MRTRIGNFRFLVGVLVVFSAATCEGASLSAVTQICNGFFGSVEAPRPSCVNGSAGGGEIIGGSGEGSGIDYPFYTDASGSEFSATAAALQDYGVFRAYASIHVEEQYPGPFDGTYRALAAGEFTDTWTITGAPVREFSISCFQSMAVQVRRPRWPWC